MRIPSIKVVASLFNLVFDGRELQQVFYRFID